MLSMLSFADDGLSNPLAKHEALSPIQILELFFY